MDGCRCDGADEKDQETPPFETRTGEGGGKRATQCQDLKVARTEIGVFFSLFPEEEIKIETRRNRRRNAQGRAFLHTFPQNGGGKVERAQWRRGRYQFSTVASAGRLRDSDRCIRLQGLR